MKYMFLLLLPLSVLLFLPSCKKGIESCPAYESDFMQEWFPYSEKSAELYYVTKEGDRDTLITRPMTEHSDIIPKSEGLKQEDEHCSVGADVYSTTSNEHPGWLNMELNHITHELVKGERLGLTIEGFSVTLFINGGVFSGKMSVETQEKYRYAKMDKLDVNGTVYSDVAVVSVLDYSIFNVKDNPPRIDKVYIAEGKGIIGYRTYPEEKEYWIE